MITRRLPCARQVERRKRIVRIVRLLSTEKTIQQSCQHDGADDDIDLVALRKENNEGERDARDWCEDQHDQTKLDQSLPMTKRFQRQQTAERSIGGRFAVEGVIIRDGRAMRGEIENAA